MKYEVTIKPGCEGFFKCLSPDSLLSLVGGSIGIFLGTYLAAKYAMKLYKYGTIQLAAKEYMKYREAIIELLNFYEKLERNLPDDRIVFQNKYSIYRDKGNKVVNGFDREKIPIELNIEFHKIFRCTYDGTGILYFINISAGHESETFEKYDKEPKLIQVEDYCIEARKAIKKIEKRLKIR